MPREIQSSAIAGTGPREEQKVDPTRLFQVEAEKQPRYSLESCVVKWEAAKKLGPPNSDMATDDFVKVSTVEMTDGTKVEAAMVCDGVSQGFGMLMARALTEQFDGFFPSFIKEISQKFPDGRIPDQAVVAFIQMVINQAKKKARAELKLTQQNPSSLNDPNYPGRQDNQALLSKATGPNFYTSYSNLAMTFVYKNIAYAVTLENSDVEACIVRSTNEVVQMYNPKPAHMDVAGDVAGVSLGTPLSGAENYKEERNQPRIVVKTARVVPGDSIVVMTDGMAKSIRNASPQSANFSAGGMLAWLTQSRMNSGSSLTEVMPELLNELPNRDADDCTVYLARVQGEANLRSAVPAPNIEKPGNVKRELSPEAKTLIDQLHSCTRVRAIEATMFALSNSNPDLILNRAFNSQTGQWELVQAKDMPALLLRVSNGESDAILPTTFNFGNSEDSGNYPFITYYRDAALKTLREELSQFPLHNNPDGKQLRLQAAVRVLSSPQAYGIYGGIQLKITDQNSGQQQVMGFRPASELKTIFDKYLSDTTQIASLQPIILNAHPGLTHLAANFQLV